ncbi:MAG: M28 family peptidase, partial [Bacilli bacterium]
MIEDLFVELQNYSERMLAKSKEEFRDYLFAKATTLGLKVGVIPDSKLARNVVVGNIEEASIVIGAHYDTPPRMASWMINHMLLFNIVLIVLMWVLLPLIIIFLPIEFAFIAYMIFIVLLFAYMFGFFSIPNHNNYNDNTSGVLSVLTLMHEIKSNQVAFVFFDNEEKGLIGSLLLSRVLKKQRKQYIILDCVGVGNTFAFYHYRGKQLAEELQSSFVNLDCPQFNH